MFHSTELKKINVIMKRKTENNKKKRINTWFKLEVRWLCHLMNYLHKLDYNKMNYQLKKKIPKTYLF